MAAIASNRARHPFPGDSGGFRSRIGILLVRRAGLGGRREPRGETAPPDVAYRDDPLYGTVHHPYSAFNQGADPLGAGMSRSACPYLGWLREWLLDGYEAALGDDPDGGGEVALCAAPLEQAA